MSLRLTLLGVTAGLALALSPIQLLAQQTYSQGIEYFKQGQYELAITAFQASLKTDSNPTIHYNLGASLYKLKRYQEAETHFIESAKEDKLAGISHYNLGLIYARLDQLKKSKKHFELAADTGNEQIQKLAEKQLNKFEKTVTPRKKKRSALNNFSGYLSASYHYDDNVSNANEDIPTETRHSDESYELFGTLNYTQALSNGSKNTYKVGMYQSRYDQFTEYDQSQWNIGAYHSLKLFESKIRLGLHAYEDTLGATDFQRRINYQLRSDINYGTSQRLRLQYDYTTFDELDPRYLSLSGTRHRFRIENRSRIFTGSSVTLGYRFENNYRNDKSTATSYTSASPIRHSVYTKLKLQLTSKWSSDIDLEHRVSNYKDANFKNSVSLGKREDIRNQATLRLARKMSKHTEMEAKYRYTNNDSNFDNKDYDSNIYSLSINFIFQ